MKVRDIIKLIEMDGWRAVSQKGSHRQYKHRVKAGRVAVAGQARRRYFYWNAEEHLSVSATRGKEMNEYTVIIEKADNNYSAYVPDLPGCIATGPTVEQTLATMREAIEFHLEGMREDGAPIPLPTSTAAVIQVAA